MHHKKQSPREITRGLFSELDLNGWATAYAREGNLCIIAATHGETIILAHVQVEHSRQCGALRFKCGRLWR
jgi:hypothetical protein